MGKRFIQQNVASGLVIHDFRPQLFARLRHMQGRHFEMTQWIARMCLQQSSLAIITFCTFEVFNDEDKKPGRERQGNG